MEITEYREAILADLLSRKKKDGTLAVDEKTAHSLLKMLSNEALSDGMLFNTPEDVAETLLEVSRLKV
ncbi:MAG: hypothetical protein SOX84_04145 [Prevotella sp.]|nr:hypothetical protein [Prevotella sp.]MDY4217956.1 hypothetical protein [Prevotella sp.]